MPEFHAEPYLYLAGLTHKAALIAWGGFYFRVQGQAPDGHCKLVDDSNLRHVHPPRRETIGARSEPYGNARVEVFDDAGGLAAFAEVTTANHAWVTGLSPDTEYTYRVIVNGEEWAAGERRDWRDGPLGWGLYRSGRGYQNRFRTHPHPEQSAPLTFAVIGDYGTGVRKPSRPDRRQREVAAALERAVEERGVRLILTTGDNIYAGKSILGVPVGETGDEDDDWFFTFYQPYRYVINRVPVYPAVGNHDGNETEASDDRQQLLDNFFLSERFSGEETAGRASIGPGLFYRFPFGSDIEFICVDTSRQSLLFGRRFFEHPNHASFLEAAFPDKASVAGGGPVWRIPFTHHPPYCAGPQHSNSRSMIARLVPLFERAGVRVVFSGHEHNFQHSRSGRVNYFVTGGGGKLRLSPPTGFEEARSLAWAAAGHFLVAEVDSQEMRITPVGEIGPDGGLTELEVSSPMGEPVSLPFVVGPGTETE
ncbi:MAG TPA: metallophosphoesterase [Blastocatellia bacterium]|nr:metallophosphoesterase [Blastocatellia bacterium]